VGCPVLPQEIDWFLTMLQRTARSLGDAELRELRAELEAYAAKLGG